MSRTISRPCAWFRKGEKLNGTTPGTVVEPHARETAAILAGQVCHECRHFRYEKGQELIRKSWFLEMLKRDHGLSHLAENVDPQELGACDAQEGLISHRFGGQECEMFEKATGLFSGTVRRCRGRR